MDFSSFEDIGDRVHQFISSLPCRDKKPDPPAKLSSKNKKIADLLKNAYADGGSSEMTAISQYIHHKLTITQKDVANHEFCIAMVEMHHLEMLGEMIESAGEDPKYLRTNNYYWTGGYVNYGQDLCEKLALDIHAEQEAISAYQALLRILQKDPGPDARQAEALIKRILDDEFIHLDLFKQAYNKYC